MHNANNSAEDTQIQPVITALLGLLGLHRVLSSGASSSLVLIAELARVVYLLFDSGLDDLLWRLGVWADSLAAIFCEAGMWRLGTSWNLDWFIYIFGWFRFGRGWWLREGRWEGKRCDGLIYNLCV